MLDDISQQLQKRQVISQPFRRNLFEPYEPPILYQTPIPHINKPKQNHSFSPVIGPNGVEYIRISDAKEVIMNMLHEKEHEIRESFVKQLTAELAVSWNRHMRQEEDQNPRNDGMPQEPPSYEDTFMYF